MMNGRVFFFAGVLSVFLINVSHAQEKDAFVLTGRITNMQGKKLTLTNLDNQRKEARIKIKNNHFQLSVSNEGDKPAIYTLQMEGADFPMLIVGQNGDTVRINGDAKNFPLAEVSGNQQSRDMQQYQKEFTPLFKKVRALNHKAALITSEEDTINIAAVQKEAKELNSELQSTGMAFIQYHPHALASLFVLMKERQSMPPARLKQLYSTLSEDIKQSSYGKIAASLINVSLTTAIGATAPDFTLKDTEGNSVRLSSFRGKYVLIDFWASWCGPCRTENPNVVAAYHKFKNKNFTILGVSLDKEKKRWENAIQQDHLDWTQVSDLKGWNNEAARLYHVTSIPQNFLLDPSGKIIAENLRGNALNNKLSDIFNK